MNKLREVFTVGLSIEFKTRYKKMMERAYKERACMTCENFIPIEQNLPGYCTAFAKCKLGGLAIKTCEKYKEDIEGRKMPWEGKGNSLKIDLSE